jgi:hypothetical protein
MTASWSTLTSHDDALSRAAGRRRINAQRQAKRSQPSPSADTARGPGPARIRYFEVSCAGFRRELSGAGAAVVVVSYSDVLWIRTLPRRLASRWAP